MPKNNDYPESVLDLVGSLWKNESKNGVVYLNIIMNDPEDKKREIKLVAFKNKKKEEDTQPDYLIYFDKTKKEEVQEASDDFDEDDI